MGGSRYEGGQVLIRGVCVMRGAQEFHGVLLESDMCLLGEGSPPNTRIQMGPL